LKIAYAYEYIIAMRNLGADDERIKVGNGKLTKVWNGLVKNIIIKSFYIKL